MKGTAMGLKWTTVIGVGLAAAVGLLIGSVLFGPALGFLKPAGQEEFASVQGDGFVAVQVGFVFLFGGLFGLPPLLADFLRRSGWVRYLGVFLCYFVGFTAAVLAAFYLKLQLLRIAGQYESLGLTPRLPVPPVFLIPLAGITALLAMFLVLRVLFRPRAAAERPGEPVEEKETVGQD